MLRSPLALSLALSLLSASSALSKDVYFPIAGSTSSLGVFKTDVRLFNPSTTKDITVQIYLLPVGNQDNSGVQALTRTVSKRQMMVLNDVVTTLGGTDLRAIRLSSADDFVATERVYAQQTPNGSCNIAGTLGQEVPAFDTSAAKKQGVLLQLKTTTGNCTQAGAASFRTNIGVVNPNTTAANVTFRLYDKNNALIGAGSAITVRPMGVVAPTNMVSGFFFSPGAADLTDAWVSYTSDQTLLVYASVVDNCTSDPTFVAMAEDIVSASGITREFYFPTAGSTSTPGVLKTDLRLFNPSSTKDITVQAYLLPIGNVNNSGVTPRAISVPRRQMVLLNDAVVTLGGTGLHAIRLTSPDDFVATERLYTPQAPTGSCNVAGTYGQEVLPLRPSTAKKQGVLLQLRNSTANCSQTGAASFHTNIGVVNPNANQASVTFRLYDKNNAPISTGSAITVPPQGVIGPTNMTSGFFFTSGSADLTDAWVSYSSDQPLFAYASVVDTCTSDPTFIPMAEDTGGGAPTPSAKSFTVTTRSWAIDFSPAPGDSLVVGDQVTLTITGRDFPHGFELQDPTGVKLVPSFTVNPGQTYTRTFTITREGTHNYYCTVSSCGNTGQHDGMFGQFVVGEASDPGDPRY